MVKTAVIGNSYDIRKNLEQDVINAYNKEITKYKRKFPGRYFWRGDNDPDFIKFNFPLNGAPINTYGIISAINSPNIEQIFVVGNNNTESTVEVLNWQLESYLKSEGKRLVFVHEGHNEDGSNYPLHQTLKKAHNAIGNDGQILFLTGDTPLFDIENTLDVEGIETADFVINFNSKLNINGDFLNKYPETGVFPRYYHLEIEHEGIIHPIKESNGYIINLNSENVSTAQKFYEMRKGISSHGIPYVKEQFGKKSFTGKLSLLLDATPFLIQLGKMKLFGSTPRFTSEQIRDLGYKLEKLNVVAVPKHESPGCLEDIDSDADLVFLDTALRKEPKIYKYNEMIAEFKEEGMKKLIQLNDWFDPKNYGQKMNTFFSKIGAISPISLDGSYKENALFELYPQYTEERLLDHKKLHLSRKYN